MVQYLITGAAGMMGTHLYESLKQKNCDVLATYHQPTIDERDKYMDKLDDQVQLDLRSFQAHSNLLSCLNLRLFFILLLKVDLMFHLSM